MPRIPNMILDCSAYIYPSHQAAINGEGVGASGFLVGVKLEKNSDRYQMYVVTNRHAVQGQQKFIRLNRKGQGVEVFEAKRNKWVLHPAGDDIAVFPLYLPQAEIEFCFVDAELFLTQGIMCAHDMGAGDDVFMVGRFISHEGKQRNTPTLRFGNIAMMPLETIRHPDFGIDQESFLVECRSIPGYSGSPVFLYKGSLVFVPQIATGGLVSTMPQTPWFLGVDWCHINNEEFVRDKAGAVLPSGWTVQSNTGMAAVVPAWRLSDILNCEMLVEERKSEDERISTNRVQGRFSIE